MIRISAFTTLALAAGVLALRPFVLRSGDQAATPGAVSARAETEGPSSDGPGDGFLWLGSRGVPLERSGDGGTFVAVLPSPAHLAVIRARFGTSPTRGVPTTYRWEAEEVEANGSCSATWQVLPGAEARAAASEPLAQPTQRSFFVDADVCALRLVVDETNAGPPTVGGVHAYESARNTLRAGRASDDGAWGGFAAAGAIDGSYARRWAGAAGKGRWTLRVDLPEPQSIDRVGIVVGFDATSVPRKGFGRTYAVSWAPLRYGIEASSDGRHFEEVARADAAGHAMVRRRLFHFAPRLTRAIRVVMNGATDGLGLADARGAPVVRELAAYLTGDSRPVMAPPWVLSINANPSEQSRFTPGGELTNDAYHAKFLQRRLAALLPRLRADDRYARALGPHGEPLEAAPSDEAGDVLESIEGDDPTLDAAFLAASDPPPLAILSGSNDWDFAGATGPDPANPKRWRWDPLLDAAQGGMGRLAPAVHARVAPLLGFCGGAQLLALLQARRADGGPPEDDLRTIDRVLRRASGRTIRGFAKPSELTRAWPTDPHPVRAKIDFDSSDRLFVDVAGASNRSSSQAFPELHADAIRADAFLPGAPLAGFELAASSEFCGSGVVAAGPLDAVFLGPKGAPCVTVPEAFRSAGGGWPIIGAQFHAEQRDFTASAPGDPPESIADPRLFLASALETMFDAYVRFAR